jgi:NitT/TauT family transport system substrate-binding protein
MTFPDLASRRRLLRALGGCVLAPVAGLTGCGWPAGESMRIGTHPWPGYELLHLAQALGHLPPDQVRLIETTSASASLRALSSGSMEGACLTLDEVLTARASGVDVVIVAVLDVSLGADAVVARAGLRSRADLRGQRIGVEHSAVGAVMLDALLAASGLSLSDVQPRYVTIDQHEKALLTGEVDALVTYEPVKSRLLQAGAHELFSSAQVPGRIVDTLAIRRDVLRDHTDAVRALVHGHLVALQAWQTEPRRHAAFLAERLGLAPERVASAYAELDLPNAARNHEWMTGAPAPLETSARQLAAVMVRAGLLETAPAMGGLLSAAYLP